HTGYRPAHRALLEATLRRLPAHDALDDLVDMTHVRWLLLRPVDWWSSPVLRDGFQALSGVSTVLARDGWTLLRLERPPAREAWFAALARGPHLGETVLGTPLAPLDPGATAEITTADGVAHGIAGAPLHLTLRVRNLG